MNSYPAYSTYATRAFTLLIALIAILACKPAADDYPAPVFIESQDCEDLQHGVLPLTSVTLTTSQGEVTVQAEVADESSEHRQGLMCRESFPSETGMLFVYTADKSDGFWMHNTYVPIDILHIDKSGKVVDKINMTPCPRNIEPVPESDQQWTLRCATDASLYVPMNPWRYTLELPEGWLAEQGMGDPIFLNMKVSGPALGE